MRKSSLGQKLVKPGGGTKRVNQDGEGVGPVADAVVDDVEEGPGLGNSRLALVCVRPFQESFKLTLTQTMALIRADHCLLVPAPTTTKMVTAVLAGSIVD